MNPKGTCIRYFFYSDQTGLEHHDGEDMLYVEDAQVSPP